MIRYSTRFKIVIVLFLVCCFHMTVAQPPNWDWAVQGYGDDSNGGSAIGVDASGNSYVMGFFMGDSVNIGGSVLYNNQYGSNFLVKYDPNGNVVWVEQLVGHIYNISGVALCADDSGNTYLTAAFMDTLQLGGVSLIATGVVDIFVAKFNTFGALVWARIAGGSSVDGSNAIAIDNSHQVYVGGNFYSPFINFGSSILTISVPSASPDILLLKFDAGGNPDWGISADGNASDYVQAITTDLFGNIYLAGKYTSDSIVFGTTVLYLTGAFPNGDIYTAKVNSSGIFEWANRIGGFEEDYPWSLCCDAAGSVYNSGYFNSDTLTIGAQVLFNAGGSGAFETDGYVVKYDSSGAVSWIRQNPGLIGWSLKIGPGNILFVGGEWFDTTVFGGITYPDLGDEVSIFTYDTAGNELWMQVSTGGTNGEIANSIAITPVGEALITGWTYSDTLQFGTTTLMDTAIGTRLIVAKLHAIPVGMEALQAAQINFYPNPATDYVDVVSEEKMKEIKVYNLLGAEVFRMTPGGQHIRIPFSSEGIFLLRVETEKGFFTGKVLVEK